MRTPPSQPPPSKPEKNNTTTTTSPSRAFSSTITTPMSQPKPVNPPRVKHSASEELEEPPAKRACNTIQDRSQHRDPFATERRLIPVVRRASQAEMAECRDYGKGVDEVRDVRKDVEESEDEVVDAQEGIGGGGVMPWTGVADGTVPVEESDGQKVVIKSEVRGSPILESRSSPMSESKEVEELDDTLAITQSQEIISIQDDDDDDDDNDNEPFEDIFAATFGAGKAKAKTKKEVVSDATNSGFSSSSRGNPSKPFISGVHATTVHDGSDTRHINTPPPPEISTRPAPLPPRRRPDINRDLSPSLVRHSKFHNRAQLLIPRLPNHENFDWTRRYWIAVLITSKRVTKTTSEKDFVWMKGNRFSTVATVFHSYCLAVMADPEDTVLVLGDEGVEMEDQMQELNYFNDRLVVFKAMKVGAQQERSLVQGIVPESETICLDLH